MRPIDEVLKQEPVFSLDQEQVETICDSIHKNLIDNIIPELKEEVTEEVKDYLIKDFANGVQKWVCEEFAPEVEKWVVNEFTPEVERWVKEYLNNKQTPLHIKDFCNNTVDEVLGGQSEACYETESSEPIKKIKMGTVEPEWNDEKHLITKAGSIQDDALAFIYGAIKKYGQNPEFYEELKEYIIKESKYIGED